MAAVRVRLIFSTNQSNRDEYNAFATASRADAAICDKTTKKKSYENDIHDENRIWKCQLKWTAKRSMKMKRRYSCRRRHLQQKRHLKNDNETEVENEIENENDNENDNENEDENACENENEIVNENEKAYEIAPHHNIDRALRLQLRTPTRYRTTGYIPIDL